MFGRTNRRAFIAGLGGAVAWPLVARGQKQQGQTARVGILNYFDARYSLVTEFTQDLRELGYIEGQNLTIIHRWANGQLDSLPGLAAQLIASRIDVMIALGPATWAAKRATTTIPIITTFSGDPVGVGLVSNLARPGGNITGFSYMSTDLAAKRVELLSELHATHSRFVVLYNPGEPVTKLELEQTERTARILGLTVQTVPVTQTSELEGAFSTAVRDGAGGVIVFTHGFAEFYKRDIIEAAARQRMPTVYGWRDFVADGGLMSYGPNVQLMVRTAASYVDRIIKGEKPGDLPIQQPDRLELIINLKTANALGINIPPTVLARADEVIE
jgi:putative ABC transport system substrate-binding protein